MTDREGTDAAGAAKGKSALVQDIVDTCVSYLQDTGPAREAASACLSSLLTRPDMDSALLEDFVTMSTGTIGAWCKKGDEASKDLSSDTFQIIGVLHCLAQIFKKGHRGKILGHCAAVLLPCLALGKQSNQLIVRKLTCKLAQRIGMTYLPPRVAAWRYQRGQRSLVKNLGSEDQDKEGAGADAGAEEEEEEEEEALADGADLDELEGIIDHLLSSLNDKDTVVRWSAAKGLGRITMRLSKDLGDDVVQVCLSAFLSASLPLYLSASLPLCL